MYKVAYTDDNMSSKTSISLPKMLSKLGNLYTEVQSPIPFGCLVGYGAKKSVGIINERKSNPDSGWFLSLAARALFLPFSGRMQ